MERTYTSRRGLHEQQIQTSRLFMDVMVPLPGFDHTLQARVVVLGASRLVRPGPSVPWDVVSRSYLCGTSYGVFVRGFDFPFRTFSPRQYEQLTNPYEAACHYARYLGTMVVPLLGCRDSLRYVYLANNPTIRPKP